MTTNTISRNRNLNNLRSVKFNYSAFHSLFIHFSARPVLWKAARWIFRRGKVGVPWSMFPNAARFFWRNPRGGQALLHRFPSCYKRGSYNRTTKLGFSQAFDEIWRPAELGVFRDLKQTRRYSGIRILRVVSNHGDGDCGAAKYTHEREISRRRDERGAPKISACAFRPRHNRHHQN